MFRIQAWLKLKRGEVRSGSGSRFFFCRFRIELWLTLNKIFGFWSSLARNTKDSNLHTHLAICRDLILSTSYTDDILKTDTLWTSASFSVLLKKNPVIIWVNAIFLYTSCIDFNDLFADILGSKLPHSTWELHSDIF